MNLCGSHVISGMNWDQWQVNSVVHTV